MSDRQYRYLSAKQQSQINRAKKKADVSKRAVMKAHAAGPVAYGYGRISHAQQVEKDSLAGQSDRVHTYFDDVITSDNAQWGGFYSEAGHVSAYKKVFFDRPVAQQLIAMMKKGDYLIIDKIDRACRRLRDCLALTTYCDAEGINLHFVQFQGLQGVNHSLFRDFFMMTMGMMAQLESDMKSQRVLEQKAHAKKRGIWTTGAAPLGTKRVGSKGRHRLVWHEEELSIMQEIVRCIDEEGMGLKATRTHIHKMLQENNCVSGRAWSHWGVKRAYILMKFYDLVEEPVHTDFAATRTADFQLVKQYGAEQKPRAQKETG